MNPLHTLLSAQMERFCTGPMISATVKLDVDALTFAGHSVNDKGETCNGKPAKASRMLVRVFTNGQRDTFKSIRAVYFQYDHQRRSVDVTTTGTGIDGQPLTTTQTDTY